jgi:hypothetical protein
MRWPCRRRRAPAFTFFNTTISLKAAYPEKNSPQSRGNRISFGTKFRFSLPSSTANLWFDST